MCRGQNKRSQKLFGYSWFYLEFGGGEYEKNVKRKWFEIVFCLFCRQKAGDKIN